MAKKENTNLSPLTPEEQESLAKYKPSEKAFNKFLDSNVGEAKPQIPVNLESYAGIDVSGKPTDFGKSKFDDARMDIDIVKSGDLPYYRAEKQPVSDKIVNGIVQASGKAVTSFVNGTVGTIYGIGSALYNGQFSKLYDNYVTQSMDKANEAISGGVPLYNTKEYEQMPWYQKMGKANFWWGDVLSGAGYTLGAVGTGAASGLVYRSIAKSLGTTGKIAQAGEALTTATTASIGEAGDEGRMGGKQWYDKTLAEVKTKYEQLGQEVPEEVILDLKTKKDQLENTIFLVNLPIIAGSNFLQFGKVMTNLKAERKAVGELGDEIGKKLERKAALGDFSKIDISPLEERLTKIAKVGKQPAIEGTQEQQQNLASVASQDFYTKKFNKQDTNILESAIIGLKEAYGTEKGWESFVVGALSTLISGGAMKKSALREAFKSDDPQIANALEILNKHNPKEVYKQLIQSDNRAKAISGEMSEAAAKGDKFEFNNAQNDLITSYTLSRIKTGQHESLKEDLESIKNMKPEEFKETFGVTPEESNKTSVAQLVQDRIEKTESIVKAYETVENTYKDFSEGNKERLIHAAVVVDDAKDRRQKLHQELMNLTVKEGSDLLVKINNEILTNLPGSKKYEKFTETEGFKEAIERVNPIRKPEIIAIVNDLEKLNQREKEYSKLFNDIIGDEEVRKANEESDKKNSADVEDEKPTDEEETEEAVTKEGQFAPGSQVQFRGQGQSVEVEDFDVEEGLVKIKGDDVLHPITDFYVPKTLPSTGPEVLNNTDLTQPYTGEPDEFTKDGKLNPNFGTGIHATGTKAAVQEILNTVSDITPITRVRLTKKVSVEGNIQRGLNHLLGKLPSSVKATLSPNKALDVVYELQTPDGTWIDAFHGRHSDQYVTVDEKGNTSTFRFTDNNRTQAKTLFKIREGDADNKKVRDLTDEEITDLINNQHKLDALNKVYQSIYNTQGETTLSAKELNEKYSITVFAKKGKFDTIKDDAVKPILSEISKANIDGEFYIFDKLNGSTWEELQLLGNPNNKDKSKELLSKVKNPNNFIGATNSRYLALGREANGELFLFGIDTQIFTNDQLSPIISNILQHKKFKNGKWEYSEKTKIGETERNEINDELSELIHIIAPTGTKLELKLDVSKDGQPSKLQIKEHTPAKANTEGYNKDGEKYYDIPLSKKTSINSIVTHANEKGLKYIHPESFRRSIPKTENTDKIPTKELAGMFLSNVSKNVFKYSKIIVDLNIPSEDIFGKILPAETKVAPTTVTPKSQSISANTIKDQIAALEDKIANSSSEEEANSYFIEIEALEKQLLEGRKLESDIDRLRGETPINKISQQSAQTFIDFPEAEANVRKLISPASVVNFDDINTLITNIENKGETWGFFAGKSIYLNKAAQKGTEFHEVFHYVFRRLLSDEQIRRLYMLARVKYGTPTIKQLSELKNRSNANKSLRKDQLEELWLEEKMADTFMNYKLGKNKLENMGLIGKILSKIQDFLIWLVGHKTELQALFENINKGSFRSDITHYNQFTKKWANPVFKQIPNGEKDTETGKRYTYTGLEEGRQIIRTIAAKVISAKMGTSKARMDVDILLDAAIAKAYQFNSLENNKDIIASKSPIEGLKIKRWLRSQQFVYSNPTSVALIKEQVKKQLDVFNFDKVDLDEEITATENERKLIDFDKNAINIGGFDSLNKEIRAYIGTTLYDTTDALGRPVKTAVDPQVVYQSIMKTLASTDTGNMMNKFRIFAENNQQTKAVYDRLTSETGYDETIGVAKLNPQLLQQFLNAFTTEKIKYLQILPNLETQTYKVFDANNAGKAQVDQWEKNFSETKNLTKSKIALQDAGSDLATGNIDKLDSIKKALASIGVDVSDTYIRYSLLAISDPFNPLIANFKDVKPLTRDDLSALAGVIAKDNSPYEKGTKGAITRLQNIAQANYVFDEQVVSPNFQDANGETRYSYIKPSLMLERTRELRQALSTPEGRKAFIEQLNTSYSHSYAFNDNNYLLTHKNADEIFSNLQLEFTGDIRQDKKGQEGTTFKGIDDRSFKLMQYGLFSAQKKIGDVTFAKFYPKVLEASASAYSIELPVEKLYSNGRPTDRAINLLYDQFLQEVERIAITEREINNPDVVKIKDYHIGKLRGLHLFYFKYLENTKLGEQILSKAKNYVSKADFHDMEEAIKTEIETNLLNEIKQENQLLEDLGITSQNLLPKNVSTKDDIGNFYVNSLININAYNDLIEMNPAFSKDAVDNVKRAKRAISAKVSFGKGNHIVGFYKEPKAKGLTKDIDVADAQAMIDMNHFKFILQREGKLSPEIFSILNKIDDGEELTWDEILTLKDKQVMLNSIKTVTSGPVDYHKMSDLILTKKLTSVKNDKGEWVAKPGKELLHNFRVQLENLSRRATMAQNPDFQWHQQMSIEQIDQIVPARILPESASKLLTYKPAELGPDGRYDFNHTNTRLIENKYSGRQVDTPSGKTEIVYGTQLIQLIDSEQDDNTIVNFQGEDISLKELRHIYQNLLSQARTNSVDQAKKFLGKLVDGNLTEKEETKFRKKLLDTLEQSGADDSLLQFFGLDPMYNLNLPNTLNKYEQLFLAHFTKGVLNQKTAGLKLTLISDYGFNVKDEKTGEYKPLKYNPNGLSEVAMPAFTRELHNLKPGDILNAKQVLEMFGQRIPTQDKHSMIAFKVVEFLPSEYGSVGIFPKEVIELSGADFDIDSIFVERKDFYMKGDKFVPFGTATTIEGKFEEFIQDQKQNNKDFIKLIKLGVPEQEALIELQLPSTLEEFKKETKEGTIILSNATINNQLVDANIAFLTNDSMTKVDKETGKAIAQTPATVKRLSDIRDKIQALQGDVSKQYNLNSPVGQFKAWKSNATGKENVGPAANANLVRAFLAKFKVHLQRNTFRPVFNGKKPIFDFSKHLDDAKNRIQDTLSTILSAMTDNAKDPIAGDLNLSLTSLGPVLQLVSLGVDLYDAMLLVNQPIVKEYTEAKERTKTAIKSDVDYAIRTSEIKENLFNKYKLTSSDDLSLTTKEMEEGINTIKPEDGKYLDVFFKLEEQGRYWQHLSKLLALNKGLPASFKETEKIKAAIEAFKINSEEELPEEAPFDIRKALKGTHIENNIRLFKDIMNMSKQYFITQSSVFTKTIDEIENSIKENIRDKAGVLNDIKLNFLSYLAINQYKKTIKRPLNQNLLTGPDSIIDQYKKIPAELKNNKLVKFLTIDNKTTVPTLIANTRIKLSGIQIEELVESFRELFNDERTNQFVRNLFEYLIVKDGMQFKNNSFIKFISPFMFTQMSDSLDVLSEEAFNDKISEESANDFKDVWFRHVDNQNYIKRLEPSKGITFSKENNQVRVKSFIEDVTLPEYTYIDKVLYKAITLDKNNATYEAVKTIGNELQSPYGFKNSEEVQKNSVFKQVEVLAETKSNIVSMDIAIPILENLKERFNLDYEIVNEPNADWSGQYVGDKVLINSAKMQMHTLFHEFAHPFIRIVRKTNKPLWNSLVREIHETKDGKKGLDIVKQSYPELDETTQIEETIVQFIGRYAAKNIDKTTGQRLIDLIKEVLKNIAEFLGITVNPSTLAKMSLKELGALMASEAKIDISTAQQYIEPGEISQEKLNISESAYKEEYVFFKKRINALEKQKHLHSAKSEEYAKIQAKIDAIQTKLDEAIAESGHEGFLEMAKSTLGFLELNTIVRLETGNIDVTADQIEYAKDILDAFDDFEGLETEVAALRKRLFPFANKLRMEQIIEHSTEATPPTQEDVDNQKKDIGSFKSWVGALADSPNYIARTIGMIIKAAQNRVETQNKKLKDVIQKEVDLLHEWGKKAGVASKNLYDVFIQEDKGTLVLTKPANEQFYTDLYEAFGKIKSTDPKIKAEGQQWIKNNAIKENGEWKSTNSKYSNKNWEKIQSTPDLKRFYDFYQQHIEEQQKFLPNKFGRNYIPNIRKETFGNILKNLIPVKRNLDGRLIISEELEADILPNMYHKKLAAADKSKDLGASLLKFGQYSNNHNEMTDILPSLRLLQDGLIHKYNDKGQIIKKEYIKSSSPDKSILGESTNLYKQVSTIIDMQVLGNMKKEQGSIPFGDIQDETGKTIGKKHILVSDVADVLLKYNSLLRIGFSPVTAVTNVFFGDISNIIEAIGGRFFSLKNMKDATNIFIAQNFKEDSFFYKLLEETNPLQELDDYDNITDVSIKTKEMSAAKLQEFAYAMQKGGEKYLQGRTALAVAIKDGYCTTKGQPTDKWNNATEKEKTELSNKIQRINQMIHGRYSQKEAAALQQNVVFRLAMQFRKWIPSAIEVRLGEKQWDNRLQAYIEGRYRTTGKLLYELYKNKGKLENGRELTELELYNVKKMVVELTLWAATAFGFALLHGGDDEEAKRRRKNPYVKLGLTLLNRVSGDLQYFYDPKSATSLTKSSIPVATTIETLFKAMGYLPGAFGEDAYYTKGSRKGKHKFTSTLARTIPGAKVVDDISRIASDNTLEELNK